MPSAMPSSWAAGFGLGLCLASIIATGALDAHLPIPWARCIAVIVACFGGVPSLEFFLRGTWAIVRTVGETLAQPVESQLDDVIEPYTVAQDEPAPEPPDYAERRRLQEVAHWHVFDRRIVSAGNAFGFDIRSLTGEGRITKVTSEKAWNLRIPALVRAGILANAPGRTTRWASGWDYERWNDERAWEQLPCPAGEPPDIVPPPYNATTPQRAATVTTVDN